MNIFEIDSLDFKKMNALIPAIIQDAFTGEVLMLAYMNQDALKETIASQQLTLFSRSKQRLWRKGETSGNTMYVKNISTDCDKDSLLIQVIPKGPACHLGFESCFEERLKPSFYFLKTLIEIIRVRKNEPREGSYTAELMRQGLQASAQKVGEEAVETVIAAVSQDKNALTSETADLLFHLLVLLEICDVTFDEILVCLQGRCNSLSSP